MIARRAGAGAVFLALSGLAGCSSAAAPGSAATEPSSAKSITATSAAPEPRCGDRDLDDKLVTFPNLGGTTLAGFVVGSGRTGIVMAAQLRQNSCSWLPYAKVLAGRGYRVLAFDFAGEGKSGPSAGAELSGDVAAAATFLRQQGAASLVLLGASRGGTAVLIAGATVTPPVTGVISLSAPSTFQGESALAAVPRLSVPVLYLAAQEDIGYNSDAKSLHDATPGAKRKIVIVPGSHHGISLVGSAPGGAEATTAIDGFLAAHAPAG